MDTITLKGEPRETGTRKARATAEKATVPCVLYGQHDEPVAFKVPNLNCIR
jgi:ribosomal protein L25 (general stress protein Ctc)